VEQWQEKDHVPPKGDKKAAMKKLGWVVGLGLLLAGAALAQTPKTDDEKILYTVGASIGRSLQPFNLTKAEQDLVRKGMQDALAGVKPPFSVEEYGPRINELLRQRMAAANKTFLDKMAKEKGAQVLPSGLIYFEEKAGTGPSPKPSDKVKVHYRGTLTNGTEFDSSFKRKEPAEFPLNGVIACWTEGVQKMKVGGKAKLVCPPSIAYGDRGSPPAVPPNAVLTFEVELLEILPPAPTGATPTGK
jgi:FKBP-type peptidyl-prolyl cis-trans isomerase FkpA